MSMLQDILDKMYIDPELLEALGEEQKQMLFIKMREEQLKRWRENEEKQEKLEKIANGRKPTDNGKKRIRWLTGADGEVWVWLMGEHPADPTIDEIIEHEEQAKAREIAENEIMTGATLGDGSDESFYGVDEPPILDHSVDKQLEDQLKDQLSKMKVSSSSSGIYDNSQICGSRAEPVESYNPKGAASYRSYTRTATPSSSVTARSGAYGVSANTRAGPPLPTKPTNLATGSRPAKATLVEDTQQTDFSNHNNNNSILRASTAKGSSGQNGDAVDVRLRCNGDRKSGATVDAEINRRQSEIFEILQERRERLQREADQDQERQRLTWEDQERKAREAEAQIREIAQKAREQHRQQSLRTSTSILPALKNTSVKSFREAIKSLPRPPRPASRKAIIEWFKNEELPRGTGMDPRTKQPALWFHGIISRDEAEKLLSNKPSGSYLVRVSERIWGYTVSYVVGDGSMKHFLIEKIAEGYQFLGTNQVVHSQLHDLVTYHETAPITATGKEILKWSVGQIFSLPDHAELFDVSLVDVSRFSSRNRF